MPREIVEANNFIIGEKVIRFDTREATLDIREFIKKDKKVLKERDPKILMGKIIGKYHILNILSYAFTREEVMDLLHKTSL